MENKEKKWIPQAGELCSWVTVPNKWDFENKKVITKVHKESMKVLLDSKNLFKDRNDAIEQANKIRMIWEYAKLEKE